MSGGWTDFESIVERILKHAKITRDELMRRIRDKMDTLGFVTAEGAAGMVEKELEAGG